MPIDIKDVVFSYNKGASFEKRALDHINLHIGDGELLGLIGHTGSGKSTLIQQLNALLKPDSGKILLDGKDINSDKSGLRELRRSVGLVFQYPEHQLFEATVGKDIAFGPENMGLSQAEVAERVTWAMDIVGLSPDIAEKSPFDLSGGQKRRAAIAGVLAMRPRVLVLDEPAAGLDPKGRDEILANIRVLHERLNITVILVSHSMEDVARMVGRIVVMSGGTIVMDGAPAEVFSEPARLEGMGLSVPQAALLIHALRAKGCDLPDGIYTSEAAAGAIMAMYNKMKSHIKEGAQ